MIPRNEILRRLRAQIHVNGHILGTVAGSGMTARYSAMGEADFCGTGDLKYDEGVQELRKL